MYSLKLTTREMSATDMVRRLGVSLSTSFWRRVDPALREALPKGSPLGRPRCSPRVVVCAIIYRLRSGCQWRALPSVFGPASTVHGWFQKLNKSGMWRDLWLQTSALLSHPDPLFMDASIIKSPLGGDLTGPSPVHRGRLGCKRSLLTDATGIPLAIDLAGANRHDSKLVEATLAASILPLKQHLIVCDKGYLGASVARAVRNNGATINLPDPMPGGSRLCEAQGQKLRWRIERTFAWINNWRALATRYERRSDNYLGMLHLWAFLLTQGRVE